MTRRRKVFLLHTRQPHVPVVLCSESVLHKSGYAAQKVGEGVSYRAYLQRILATNLLARARRKLVDI